MAIADPRDAHASSQLDTDKIIGIFEGSFTAALTGGSQPTFTENMQTSGFGDTCLVQCIFRVDGGEWQDEGTFSERADAFVQVASFSRHNEVGVMAANVDAVNHTVDYKLVALAKEGQGDIEPIQVAQNTVYDFIGTNLLKVNMSGVVDFTMPTGFTAIGINVNHRSGYIPTSRSHYESQGQIWSSSMIGMSNPSVIENSLVAMDTIVAAFAVVGSNFSAGQPSKLHYFVYYDD